MSVVVYIGFGANLGNPSLKFDEAVKELKLLTQTKLIGLSSLYETQPIGLVDGGPNFVNAVIAIETGIGPENLFAQLRAAEKKLGKSVNHRSDLSRIIDLDLLFYGAEIVDTEDLRIPHPRLLERAFVLGPMAEIAPDFVHPIERETISNLLNRLGPEHLAMIKRF
jgi:2-amino-4-hydroxy-6-hydroxymethyldihydropteridine diphosphokinase